MQDFKHLSVAFESIYKQLSWGCFVQDSVLGLGHKDGKNMEQKIIIIFLLFDKNQSERLQAALIWQIFWAVLF